MAALCLWVGCVGKETPNIEVVYYYIPHCMSCEKVLEGLHERGFPSRVRLRTVPYNTEEGEAAATRYGFVTHGVILRDARGTLLWEEKDHDVTAADVRVAAALALEGRPIVATR